MGAGLGKKLALAATWLLLAACGRLLSIDDVIYAPGADADARPSDAGLGTDASPTEASTSDVAPQDASAPRFCQRDAGPGLIICDDFDGVDFAAWTGITNNAGPLVRDDASFTSPPYSLLAVPPPGAGGMTSVLSISIPGAAAGLVVEASVLTQAVGTTDIDLLQLQVTQGGAVTQAALTFTGGLWVLERQDPIGYQAVPTNATFEAWKRVRIDWTFSVDGGDGRTTMYVNEAPVATDAFTKQVPVGMNVLVGVPYLKGNGSPWRVRFDDVIVHVK